MIEYLTSFDFLILIVKIVVIFGAVMNVVGLLSWVERKMMARVQMRPGPTVLFCWARQLRNPPSRALTCQISK